MLKNGVFFEKKNNVISFDFSDNYAQYPEGNVLRVEIKDIDYGFLFKLKTLNFKPETTYLSLFLDPDIGNPLTNFASYDSAGKILYVSSSGGPYFGVLTFKNDVLCGAFKNEEYAYPYGGVPDSLQYLFMSGKLKEKFDIFPSDYSIYISRKIFPPDSLLFVIFAGENYDTLLEKRKKILERINIKQETNFKGISKVWPNPFIDPYQKELKIEVMGEGRIIFYDVTGRKAYEVTGLKKGLNVIKLKNFRNSGIYFLKFENKKRIYKLIYLNLR